MEESSTGCLDCESGIQPLSYRASRKCFSHICNIFRCTALFSANAQRVLVTIVTLFFSALLEFGLAFIGSKAMKVPTITTSFLSLSVLKAGMNNISEKVVQ